MGFQPVFPHAAKIADREVRATGKPNHPQRTLPRKRMCPQGTSNDWKNGSKKFQRLEKTQKKFPMIGKTPFFVPFRVFGFPS